MQRAIMDEMRGLAFSFGLFLCAPVSFAQSDVAPSYHQLLQTRLPVVELGPKTVERQFNEQGRLVKQKTTIRGSLPLSVEELEISYNPQTRVRTTKRGSTITRIDRETYDHQGTLTLRETVWSDENDGKLNRRTLASLKYTDYERLFRKNTVRLESYQECKKTSGSECDASSSSLPLSFETIQSMGADEFARHACEADDVYYLPNRFAIDKSSCQTGVDAIVAATKQVTGPMLSCLSEVNKPLADLFALTVDSRFPMIRCASDETRLPIEKVCQDDAKCAEKFRAARNSSAGMFSSRRPNEIFLTGSDPANEDGGHYGLASTIFHEMLHACSHDIEPPRSSLAGVNHDHSANDTSRYADAIYGCEALCAPNPIAITREGCVACAKAQVSDEPSTASDALIGDCERFATAEWRNQFEKTRSLDEVCKHSSLEGKACAPKALIKIAKQYRDVLADPQASNALAQEAIRSSSGNASYEVKGGRIVARTMTATAETAYAKHVQEINLRLIDGFCAELEAAPKMSFAEFSKLRTEYDSIGSGRFEWTALKTETITPPVFQVSYVKPLGKSEQKSLLDAARLYCKKRI